MLEKLRTLGGRLAAAGAFAAWGWSIAAAAGCGQAPTVPAGASPAAAATARWEWLCRTRRLLAARREQVERNGGSRDPGVRRELAVLGDEYERRLIDFINADPPLAGTPLSTRQQTALRMKSDEDIVLAHDHIARGGDYRRAIEIYEAALALDPENQRLRAELGRAQAARFVSPEHFAQIAKGMAPDQIRSLLGQPNANDVRSYPDRGVVGWFYPKDPTGAAAAVWFARRGSEISVFSTDWNAVR